MYNKQHSLFKDGLNDDFQVSALLKVSLKLIYSPTNNHRYLRMSVKFLVNLRLGENQSSQILDA